MAEINEEPTVCTRWRKRAILAGFVSGFFLVLAGTVLLSAFFILSTGNRPCQQRNSLHCCRLSNSFTGEICGVVSVVPYYFRRVYKSKMLQNNGKKFSYSSYCLRDSQWRLTKISRSTLHGNQMKDFGQKILMRMMKVHHLVTNRLLKWQGCPNTILKRIAVRSRTIML